MSALGLQGERELIKEARTLNDLFRGRNEIAHELDMTPASAAARGRRARRERSVSLYINMCHIGVDFAQRVLNA